MVKNLGFYKRLYFSFRGMLFYKKLLNKYKVNNSTFILIQESNDEELIQYGNMYMNEFIKNNNFQKLIILTSKEYNQRLDNTQFQTETIYCSVKQINWLICLYCMYQFSRNILIFSINRPNTNKLSNIIHTNILTKKEAVAIGIYGLNSL